jgi:hypothetical protein
MLVKFILTKFYLCELGSSLCKRWKPLLEGKFVLLRFGFLCVAPLWLGGLRGKKSTLALAGRYR